MRLTGNQVTLRAMEPSDVDLLYKWENDTELWNCSSATVPYSRYDLQNYVNHSGNLFETGQLRLMIDLVDSHTTIGCIDFYDFQPRFLRGEVAFLIDRPYQRKGYASEALNLLKDYLFNFLHIHQVYAYVLQDNTTSLGVCHNAGFEEKVLLSDWFCDDKGWHDAYLLTCKKEEQN